MLRLPVAEIHFAEDHPAGPGHFPGNPIIPGALLLDAVLQALGVGEAELRAMKFFYPVRPGARLRVTSQSLPGGALKFDCRLADGTLAASGTLA